MKEVRFTTNLAIFNVVLSGTSKFVDRGLIPLTAARALKT